MAITKSAKKALRQSLKRKRRNLQRKVKIKDLIKTMRSLVLQKKAKGDKSSSPASLPAIEEAKKLLPQIYKLLDKAAKAGLIKKNTASRKKARITKLISKSQQ